MTDKQRKFCEEYLVDLNATQAAIRAGYSENSAGQIGEQNLKKLEIQEYLSNKQKELSESHNMDICTVIEKNKAIEVTRQFFMTALKEAAAYDLPGNLNQSDTAGLSRVKSVLCLNELLFVIIDIPYPLMNSLIFTVCHNLSITPFLLRVKSEGK